MATDIQILYVNKSNDQDNPSILVFQKPTESNFAAESTAWQVIDSIGYNCWHKFTYTLDTEVQVLWDNGNSGTFPIATKNGKNYSLKQSNGGFTLEESGNSGASDEFDVTNKVSVKDGVCVVASKDGKAILKKQAIAKNQKAEFVFHPKLYFGLSSEYQVGDIVDSAVMSDDFKDISLEGLQSLTVTLTGNATNGYAFEVSDTVPL
ncbi:MAG: hypothetical protein U7123_00240 [Potamolinea sp.]